MMRRISRGTLPGVLSLLLFLAGEGAGAPLPNKATDASRVLQPAYSGMEFYVHRPAGLPEGWYATYDGYLVYRDGGGVWRYGSEGPSGPVRTNYVVGSVVPSLVGLSPIVKPTAPTVWDAPLPQRGIAFPYAPQWTRDPAFTAIGDWGKSVDRMGVLGKPAAPMAWKGERPRVIYVWTGRRWHQITPKEGGRPFTELRGHLYNLTVLVNQSKMVWSDEDTAALARCAETWGYAWMGQIYLMRPSWPH